jgi:hypothetical protein
MYKKGLIVFGLCFVIGLFLYLLPFFLPSKRSERILEKWEVKTKTSRIQVTAYGEDNNVVPGAYYVFEAVNSSNNSIKIMTFRHDDPISIPRENIRLVSENTVYIFMGWKYAVSTDGGVTWSVWDGEKNLRGWRCCNYSLIENVEITPDGKGKMYIDVTSPTRSEIPVLYTKDYGKTWCLEP